jgi:hypothetical protein
LQDDERPWLEQALGASWHQRDMEGMAMGYDIESLVPQHVQEVRQQRLPLIDKVEHEVEARLKTQINYWDRKAQERAGKKTHLSSQNAAATAEKLTDRLQRRHELLDKERKISALPDLLDAAGDPA